MAVEGIIGIKLGMTQIFAEDGNLVGCTVLQAGPCVVVQMRTKQKDGYEAAQLGLVEFVKPQRVNKALTGHFKKANVPPMKVMREVRVFESEKGESKDETKVGDRVLVDGFKAGELVDISGVSKGKGFAGGVKRWHYAGGDATHGETSNREWHRRQFVPVTCLEESTFSRSHGQCESDREEFESDQGGHRRKPAAGAGFGAGSSRAIHFHQ